MTGDGLWWWEKPRRYGRQGDFVLVKGRDQRIVCPICGDDFIVYSGNYFCDSLGDTCDWALASPAETDHDKAVCDLLGLVYG